MAIIIITLKSTITSLDFYKKYGFIQTDELTGPIIQGVTIRGYPSVGIQWKEV